jgi:hypothetical protein
MLRYENRWRLRNGVQASPVSIPARLEKDNSGVTSVLQMVYVIIVLFNFIVMIFIPGNI